MALGCHWGNISICHQTLHIHVAFLPYTLYLMLSPMATYEHGNRRRYKHPKEITVGWKLLHLPNTGELMLHNQKTCCSSSDFTEDPSTSGQQTLIYGSRIRLPPSSQNDWFLCTAEYWQHRCQWGIEDRVLFYKWPQVQVSELLLSLLTSRKYHCISIYLPSIDCQYMSQFSSVSIEKLSLLLL